VGIPEREINVSYLSLLICDKSISVAGINKAKYFIWGMG
jgi:hypothetical protein